MRAGTVLIRQPQALFAALRASSGDASFNEETLRALQALGYVAWEKEPSEEP